LQGASPWDNIRACGSCGRVFEAPWAPWAIWFCLICGWLTLLMAALVVVSVMFESKDAGAALKATPVMLVPLFILPAAYRQRRRRRQGTMHEVAPPPADRH
jgi:L-asparagine transporter-like permease